MHVNIQDYIDDLLDYCFQETNYLKTIEYFVIYCRFEPKLTPYPLNITIETPKDNFKFVKFT